MDLTNFGKAVRKIRIDKNIMQKDMAMALDCTPAYLSAIENGKRRLPDDFIDRIGKLYPLSAGEEAELRAAADADRNTFSFKVSADDHETRELLLSLSRSEIPKEMVVELLSKLRGEER